MLFEKETIPNYHREWLGTFLGQIILWFIFISVQKIVCLLQNLMNDFDPNTPTKQTQNIFEWLRKRYKQNLRVKLNFLS